MFDHGITPTGDVTQSAIDKAVETVRRLVGWHVWPVRDETLTVDTPGDSLVILPTKNLVEVLDVKVDGQEVDSADVRWSTDGMLTLLRVPRGFRRVSVRCRHGYESALDLAVVCLSMAKRDSQPTQQYSVGSISVGAPGSVTPQSTEWRVLDGYKLGPLP